MIKFSIIFPTNTKKNQTYLQVFCSDKRGYHTTDIDPFLFGKKFDISISGKYAEQNEQVFTDVHLYYVMP
jgi:hypothetical protein